MGENRLTHPASFANLPDRLRVDRRWDGQARLIEIAREDGRKALVPFEPGIADLEERQIILDPDFLV